MDPSPQTVEVVQLSGDALLWVKAGFVVQLAGLVVVVMLLVSIAIVLFWRGA